jgi:outer membrane protein
MVYRSVWESIFQYLVFNPYKWDKLIQPLELNAAISTYTFERENIKSNIVQLYFDVLIAQTAKQIAITNKISHIRLDTIAVEKFELGKISRDEKLQIETGLENSEIVLKQYQYDEVISFNSLNSYLNGAQLDSTIKFVIPAILIPAKINEEEIIELATRNYPQLLRNKINILEAQRNIAQGLKLITASVPIYTAVLVGQEVHSRSKISILSLLWRSS